MQKHGHRDPVEERADDDREPKRKKPKKRGRYIAIADPSPSCVILGWSKICALGCENS